MEIIDGEKFKEVKTLEVTTSTPVDEFQKKACKRFCKWEDWRFGLYSVQNKAWMTQGTMGDYGLEPMVSLSPLFLIGVCHDINPCQLQSVLHLKPRTADFFDDQEEHEEPQKKLKASTSSLSFNLFSRTVMETKVSTPFSVHASIEIHLFSSMACRGSRRWRSTSRSSCSTKKER